MGAVNRPHLLNWVELIAQQSFGNLIKGGKFFGDKMINLNNFKCSEFSVRCLDQGQLFEMLHN